MSDTIKELPEQQRARLGQVVIWYQGGERSLQPHVAIVTGIGLRSLNLNVLSPVSYNFSIRDGVRHVKDGEARPHELIEAGAWEHTPETLRLMEMERMLVEIREQIRTLRAKGG